MKLLDISPVRQQRLSLEARHSQAKRSYEALHAQVLKHQARVAWQPEVRDVLETLQHREHERAVGAYEQLLTALVQDVLPGQREVVMNLYTHGGLPALDIFLRKGQKPLEDLFQGTGGSVTNIISAGLRAISLLRSGKRRFLVLDEADCWIKPIWAPRFANVIQQMAVQMGVQVLMISHHDETLFPMIPHRLRLEKHAQGLTAGWSPEAEEPVWNDDQVGIRSLTLEDFQAHALTHLPLGPAVTLLCGDNDIGKSAIVTALRSVFLGEAKDTVVRHFQKSARATVDFGPEHILRWERHLKGKIKESYCHYKADEGPDHPIRLTHGAKSVPDWLEPTFGIGLIDGLDVQIGHQKTPVFLLDKPSTMQAKALAIGQDAGHVQTMMALDKRETAEAKAAIKVGERELEMLSRSIQAAGPLIARRAEWEKIEAEHARLEERATQRQELEELLVRWRTATNRVRATQDLAQPFAVCVPVLRFNPSHVVLAQRWVKALATRQATCNLGDGLPATTPTLQAPPLVALQGRWQRALERHGAMDPLAHTRVPDLVHARPTQAWEGLAVRWRKGHTQREVLERLQRSSLPAAAPAPSRSLPWEKLLQRWSGAVAQLDKVHDELEKVKAREEEIGHDSATCPQCGQQWSPPT